MDAPGFQFSCDRFIYGIGGLVSRNVSKTFRVQKNVERMRDEMQIVNDVTADVKRKVRWPKQQNQTPPASVKGYIKRAEDAVKEAADLAKESSQQASCFGGFCWRKPMFGRRVFKNLRKLKELANEGREYDQRVLTQLAGKSPREQAERRPTEGEMMGRERLIEEIWEYLLERPAGIIGLSGMSGVGKTTVLEEINNELCDLFKGFDQIDNGLCDHLKGFDAVIWVSMRKGMKEQEVQHIIAEKIGVSDESWDGKSSEDKANTVLRGLMRYKRFVLFLDDLWEDIDLKAVGVPHLEKKPESSKLVFTSRSDTTCWRMRIHKLIDVECFGEGEARKLFESMVGEETLNSHPSIREHAKVVASKCQGLPLALKIIGQAMSPKKTLKEWQHVMEVLKNSPHEFEDVDEKLFERIRLSYDNLDRSRKSCFLSCCLYPEHHKISRKELIDLWIGEGILEKGADSADLRGHGIIQELIRQHLLEEHDDVHVTLHDVVRDMALWIARHDNKNEGEEKFYVRAGMQLVKGPEAMDGIKKMSLMKTGIEYLETPPVCNHVTTLFLNDNPLKTIQDGFFRHMSMVRVLNLSNDLELTQLPPDISTLAHLEFLDLSNSGIQELPEWLKSLKNLKCLNLENTPQLHTIPAGLISALPKLRVLRMLGCGSSQATEGSLLSDGGSRLMEEAKCLQDLEMFTTTLGNSEAVAKFFNLPELQKRTQCLQLQNVVDNKKSFTFFAENMETLETLSISNCRHMEPLKFDCHGRSRRVTGGLSRLEVVEIDSCSKLTDLTWLVLASNLKRLVVSNCPDMKDIINTRKLGQYPDPLNPFRALQSLELKNLRQLVGIYKDALTLELLKEITVVGCNNLHKLPLDYNITKSRKFTIHGQSFWWNQLVWEDRSTERTFFAFFQAMN